MSHLFFEIRYIFTVLRVDQKDLPRSEGDFLINTFDISF